MCFNERVGHKVKGTTREGRPRTDTPQKPSQGDINSRKARIYENETRCVFVCPVPRGPKQGYTNTHKNSNEFLPPFFRRRAVR